jgi:hypothetical protein
MHRWMKITLTIIIIIIIIACLCGSIWFYIFLINQIYVNDKTILPFFIVFTITIFMGSFGGVLQSLRDFIIVNSQYDLSSFIKKLIHFTVGILSGIGGAFAVNLFFLSINKINYNFNLENIMFLMGLDIVGDF